MRLKRAHTRLGDYGLYTILRIRKHLDIPLTLTIMFTLAVARDALAPGPAAPGA